MKTLTKICPSCLRFYKRSYFGRSEKKKNGAWGKGKWALFVYHNEVTRKCKKHHVQSLHHRTKRRNQIKCTMPKWADEDAIKDIYSRCFELNKLNSGKYEVDHEIPLNGKLVSGLHIETNLKIIKASENRKKSNSFTL